MDSYQYWRERETEQRMNNISDEKKYDAEIEKIYKNMLSNTQKEIDAFFGKYATKEGISMAEAKKRVDKLDIEAYSEKAKKYVANRDLSPQANEEMRLYNLTMKVNRLEMLKANIGMKLVDGFSDLDEKFKKNLTTRTQDELERQAGILGKTVKNPSAMADSIVNASFNNATFSQRIWSHQELLKSELNKQLQSGLISGKNPRDLARSIQRVFGSSTYNAERLMRTELARVQTDAQAQSYERNGFAEYEFLALGSSACEICRELDGKVFKTRHMLPGENAPPMHPNCRCSTAPYYGDETAADFTQDMLKEASDSIDDIVDMTPKERLDLAKKFTVEKANADNFFINSVAEWDRKSSAPKRDPDHISYSRRDHKVSSRYWYTDEGVYRKSNHWGSDVASCSWYLDDASHYKNEGVIVGNLSTGFVKWEDIYAKGFVTTDRRTKRYGLSGFEFTK